MSVISKLPEGYRISLQLILKIEGYSHPEIAPNWGFTVVHQKSQLSKAKSGFKGISNQKKD